MTLRFGASVLWILLVGMTPGIGLGSVTHVFLVQNSGWMEPFYNDPESQFKPLVKAVIQVMPAAQARIVVAAFNQSVAGQRSPVVLYDGNDLVAGAAVVDAIEPARKPGTSVYADTDFGEALRAIVTEHLQESPAIIWIITNNKNSPGNDADTAARNREFYELLHTESAVTRTFAFPLAMPVKGNQYRASGLMVYALGYGAVAAEWLERMLEAGVMARVFTDAPARLKPLDRDAVVFVPRAIPGDSGIKALLDDDGRSLVLEVDADSRPKQVEIHGAFRNEFFPYTIRHAALSATLVSGDWAGELSITPERLDRALAPGEALDVAVSMPIPSAQIPTLWSLEALARMGTAHVIVAELRISLIDQALEIGPGFIERMSTIFPGDPMPEVFKPGANARASTATIPVRIRVSYPLYPLLTVAGLVMLLLGLVALALVLMSRERRFDVILNGQPRKVVVKAFRSVELRSLDGNHLATLKRRLGKPGVAWLAPGATVQVKT